MLLKEGNKQKHNDMVLETINKVASDSDAVVLAQGSMICLLPYLGHHQNTCFKQPTLRSSKHSKGTWTVNILK